MKLACTECSSGGVGDNANGALPLEGDVLFPIYIVREYLLSMTMQL